MIIRKTQSKDLDQVLLLYKNARHFMTENGNPHQWVNAYPQKNVIEEDILRGKSYVCLEKDIIVATFYFALEDEPTYSIIEKGSWLNDNPYGVIHRITTNGLVKGAATFSIDWCLTQCGNIRIDTHEDNIPMQHLLVKCNFTQCGVISLKNGDKRIAYQRTLAL
jgi:RimJ/RimL family protein N-acetyltransferase